MMAIELALNRIIKMIEIAATSSLSLECPLIVLHILLVARKLGKLRKFNMFPPQNHVQRGQYPTEHIISIHCNANAKKHKYTPKTQWTINNNTHCNCYCYCFFFMCHLVIIRLDSIQFEWSTSKLLSFFSSSSSFTFNVKPRKWFRIHYVKLCCLVWIVVVVDVNGWIVSTSNAKSQQELSDFKLQINIACLLLLLLLLYHQNERPFLWPAA